MKKIFYAIFAVAMLALASCEGKNVDIMDLDPSQFDNSEYKCWMYTVKNSDINYTAYVWETEAGLVKMLQLQSQVLIRKPKITYQETSADDKNGCDSKNED
jgi:hypothetical protein